MCLVDVGLGQGRSALLTKGTVFSKFPLEIMLRWKVEARKKSILIL